MNAYNEIDGILCAADRDSPHRNCCGTSGGSKASSRPTTSRSGSSPTITGWRWTGERRGARTGGRSRCRVARHRLLWRPAAARDRRGAPRRGDARRGGAAGAVHEVRPRPLRRAVRRRRGRRVGGGSDVGSPRARAHDRPQEHRAAAQRWSSSVGRRRRVDCRDRTECGHGPQSLRRLRVPGARRVAAERARQWAEQSLDSRCGVGRDRSGADRIALGARRAPCTLRLECVVRSGLRRHRLVRRRFRRGGRAGRRRRRRGPGHGRQVRSHRGLHERRVPRPCFTRPPGRAGGARRRRAGDGHPCRPRARGGTPVGERVGSTSTARRSSWRGFRARKARPRSPTS